MIIDNELRRIGHKIWETYYRARRSTDDGEPFRGLVRAYLSEYPYDYRSSDLYPLIGLGRWIDGACRTYVASDREFFSALCMTDVSYDAYEDIRFPWPVFAIAVPDGLFGSYHMILVGQLRGLGMRRAREVKLPPYDLEVALRRDEVEEERDIGFLALMNMRLDGRDDTISRYDHRGVADLLFEQHDELPLLGAMNIKMNEADSRLLELAAKVVVGMLYTHQHSSHWSLAKPPSRLKSDPRFGPPDHRVMVIGHPIKVDVTKAVRDYIVEGRSSPAFQTLVAGHRKRQVIGIGRKGRKIIWVEPYWRGPIEAPILVRPYEVGHD